MTTTSRLPFVPVPVAAELASVNAALTAMPHPDPAAPEGLALLRGSTFAPPVPLELTPVEMTFPGPTGELRARVFQPDGPVRAVLLNLHGGGFCIGAPEDDDWFCDLVARRCRVAVVSTQYRLAPEHPFPAGLDDCIAAARWLAADGPALFGTDRLLVGGGSAGGYYAAQVLLWLRSVGLADRVVAANLLFGVYDLSRTPSQRAATPDTLVLNSGRIRAFFRNAFPGRSPEELRDARYSPLYADLSGLPPALFTVGDLDPMLDDSLFMAARWRAAGSACELDVWPDCVHGFTNLAPETGRVAWERMCSWLTGQLDAAGL
jgi:acetyl esterase